MYPKKRQAPIGTAVPSGAYLRLRWTWNADKRDTDQKSFFGLTGFVATYVPKVSPRSVPRDLGIVPHLLPWFRDSGLVVYEK